ncbi:MAG: DUF1761 family protein [Saprospiraceae bacterium]|nr:DUF1761 family protein [Saprospiraceae bacterium]HMW38674.1 DUF1761 family protein [Saprospiraceae bacterium]HMX88194.1 DUF1761 family protein [Saprospiraceae bacterium]HMZ39932.1 DUF1761 family protein [Saprospiraceae bacterium]HNA63888.1 DUF1761 family protein [Saprospiraceae bacterium]
MNTTKLLLATLGGAIASWLCGWLIYGMVLMGPMKEAMTDGAKAIMKPDGTESMILYFVSSLFFALLLAYIYERWGNIRTMQTGAMAGAIIGILFAMSIDTGIMAGSDMFNSHMVLVYDAMGYLVMGGVTGAVVGWILGYNRQ